MSKSVLATQSHHQFQLTVTLPISEIDKESEQLLIEAAKEVEIPGFRKGKAPMKQVEQKLDRAKIYEQALQKLLPPAYKAALDEHQLHPIIDPQVELLKTE